MSKQKEYTVKIINALSELLNEPELHKELEDNDNAIAFIHAISNIAPCIIVSGIIGENKNLIEFNHLANQLIFQLKD